MNTITAQQFWQFSTSYYSQPKVAELCLKLQNQAQLNVNLLLLCRWLDLHHLFLNPLQIQQLTECTTLLDKTLLHPLRSVRKGIPQAPLTATQNRKIKDQLLSTELTLERIQQQQLIDVLATINLSSTPSQTCNLILYFERAANPINEETRQLLKQLIDIDWNKLEALLYQRSEAALEGGVSDQTIDTIFDEEITKP